METAKWYVVHTFSGYENKVQQIIQKIVENRKIHDLIQDVVIPTEKVKEVKDGKERDIERKIYPGYVYVKMVVTDDTWYVVRNTRGVTGFVGPEGDPTPLTQKEIENIFGNVSDKVKTEVDYKIGDSIKIIGTAMDGFIGVVDGIDTENSSVTVLVDFFGTQTPTKLQLSQVEKA